MSPLFRWILRQINDGQPVSARTVAANLAGVAVRWMVVCLLQWLGVTN